jgi:ribose 5-phosphate isomerase B
MEGLKMRLALASDHAAFELKTTVSQYLARRGFEFQDFGSNTGEAVDYADTGGRAVESVVRGECDRAILFCGTGLGMAIVANKFRGIRATPCWSEYTAEVSRSHNNSNCLCLGGRVLTAEEAVRIVEVWLRTAFEGGRHQRRLDKIAALEERNCLS